MHCSTICAILRWHLISVRFGDFWQFCLTITHEKWQIGVRVFVARECQDLEGRVLKAGKKGFQPCWGVVLALKWLPGHSALLWGTAGWAILETRPLLARIAVVGATLGLLKQQRNLQGSLDRRWQDPNAAREGWNLVLLSLLPRQLLHLHHEHGSMGPLCLG